MIYRHTPGPWEGGGGHSLPIVATVKGKPTQIGLAQPCGDRLTDDEVVANALLMRAAPDLLAALRAFVGVEWEWDNIRPEDWQRGWVLVEDIERAKAAIAKATEAAP